MAGFYDHGRLGQTKPLSQKSTQRLVGCALDRWRGYPKLQRIPMHPDVLGARRLGLNLHGQEGPLRTVLDYGLH